MTIQFPNEKKGLQQTYPLLFPVPYPPLPGKRTASSSMGSENNDTEFDRKKKTRCKTGLNQSIPLFSLKSIPISSKYLLPIASKWNSQGYSGCTVEVAKETGFTYDFTCWLFQYFFFSTHIHLNISIVLHGLITTLALPFRTGNCICYLNPSFSHSLS